MIENLNKILVISSILISIIIIIAYSYRCSKLKIDVDVSKVVRLIFDINSVLVGIVLVLGSIFEEILNSISGVEFFIFISGVVLIIIFVKIISREFELVKEDSIKAEFKEEEK